MKKILKSVLFFYKKIPFLSKLWNLVSNKTLLPVTIEGRVIRVYKGHWAAIATDNYEPETLKVFKGLLKEGINFLDIGANVGLFSTIAISRGAKVSSFEPHPEIRKILKKNLKGSDHNIYKYAASDVEECVKLFISDEPGSHSLSMGDGNFVKVQAVMLDTIINEKVDLIKLDVEGAEVKAIRGMHNILNRYKPALIIEVDEEHLIRFDENFASLKRTLDQYGYIHERIGNEQNYLFI